MNLIYFDLYQSTRLEKFVTGKYIQFLYNTLFFIFMLKFYILEILVIGSLWTILESKWGTTCDMETSFVHGGGAA